MLDTKSEKDHKSMKTPLIVNAINWESSGKTVRSGKSLNQAQDNVKITGKAIKT